MTMTFQMLSDSHTDGSGIGVRLGHWGTRCAELFLSAMKGLKHSSNREVEAGLY